MRWHPATRSSDNGSYGMSGPGLLGSLRLEASKFGNLAPLLGLCGDELPEAGGHHRHRHTTQIGEPHFQRRIGEARVDLLVQLGDDLYGRILGHTNAMPRTRLVARHELAHGRDVR